MAAEKPAPTAADYLASAVSPALVMVMVGSLVYFLVEVLYVGDYSDRLNWILGFFVFAIVLIARMTLRNDTSAPAALYGIGLAVPTWIALQMFVEYPKGPLATLSWVINVALMGVVWWAAHKLTKDCTRAEDDD